MREVKFRGYATEEMIDSQWVYGTGIHKTVFTDEYAERTGIKEEWFIFTDNGWIQVEPKSIGQYTGLKDMNGFEIYEGDIYKTTTPILGQVFFHADGGWLVEAKEREFVLRKINSLNHGEVIGNSYENPELIK